MNLRPYQQQAFDSITSGWEECQRQLAVIATGGGKTILFSHLAAAEPGRTLILAHRAELIQQAVAKLHAATGIFASVEMGDSRAIPGHGVVVASVQSMRARLAKYDPQAFDLVIADEAHHALASEWQSVLRHFTTARVLGVTATPSRSDKKALGSYFQRLACEVTLLDLIRDGFLSPIRALKLPVEVDVSTLRTRRGDLAAGDVGCALSPRLAAVADAVADEIWCRKTLVFLPLCETSEAFAAALRERGIDARHVAGDSPDRAELLAWFSTPGPKCLCNAMLLTEGYDEPSVDCLVMLRATQSGALYSQMVGRGTRLYDGKEFCVLRGSKILTNKGLVPIELLTSSHKVWDGVEFVSHSGAICRGVKPVITYEGLTATPDHEVWTADGWQTLQRVSERQIPIAITGAGGDPIREADACFTGVQKDRNIHQDAFGVSRLQKATVDAEGGSHQGLNKLQGCLFPFPEDSTLADQSDLSDETAVRKSEGYRVCELRGKGNSVPVLDCVGSRIVDTGESRSGQDEGVGSDQQRWELRGWQSPLVNQTAELGSHTEASPSAKSSQDTGRIPGCEVCGQHVVQNALQWDDAGRDQASVSQSSINQTEGEVWDILNCGPLHRFTCEGLLVHNCLILDPLWITGDHRLCKPADICAGSPEHRDALQKQLDLGEDLLEAEAKAQTNLAESLERKLKEAAKKKAPKGLIDPVAWALALHDGDLAEWEPTMESDAEPATAGQMRDLAEFGLWAEGDRMCRGYAAALLARVHERKRLGLASPKQVALLRRLGHANADTMTASEAGYFFGRGIRGRRVA